MIVHESALIDEGDLPHEFVECGCEGRGVDIHCEICVRNAAYSMHPRVVFGMCDYCGREGELYSVQYENEDRSFYDAACVCRDGCEIEVPL